MTGYEEKLSKYLTASIPLGDDCHLYFKRDLYYKGTRSEAVVVYFKDNYNESTTQLAALRSGRWEFPNQHNAEIFWSYAKRFGSSMRRNLNLLTTPLRSLESVAFEMKCFRRRFRLTSIKTSRKIKQSIQSK